MERLTQDDADLLAIETDIAAVHGLTIGVFEGPEPAFDDLRDHVALRIPLVPRLRQRLIDVPFDLARPLWVDDPHFSLDFHLRHTALPERREDDALAALVSRLMSQRLDRGKPLWELWMVSGLKDNHWALLSKVHYAMIDGVSGTDVFGLLLDDAAVPETSDDFRPRPLPTNSSLIPSAIIESLLNPLEQARNVQSLATAPVRLGRKAIESATSSSRPRGFGTTLGPHRRWQRMQLPLAETRKVRDRHDCTTTDVILAGITGGIRHYLLELGERLPRQLSTLIPLAVATEATGFAHGVTTLRALLPVGTDDPVARLDSISAQTRLRARSEGAVGSESLRRQHQFSSPTVMAGGMRATFLDSGSLRNVDTVTINIPGPGETQTVMGSELLKAYPVIPLAGGVRMAVAVLSYRDDLSFGVTGDWDSTPELHLLTEGIRIAITDLLD